MNATFCIWRLQTNLFIYVIRKPNFQNDFVWARSLEDISDEEHYRQIVKKPDSVGLFALFTAKRLLWVIKEAGESWEGSYFREIILQNNVFRFLASAENVLDADEVCFLHDNAPCFKARATQDLLLNSGLDFFASNQWPGNSPDLNPAETIGAIIKDRVENLLLRVEGQGRYSRATLLENLQTVLRELEFDTELFERLLSSYPRRLQAVMEAQGGHTEY